MFECEVCGLLSLGGASCPACGSQLRTDLSKTMFAEGDLPSEVPGLDEAAESWYELEGIEPPARASEPASKNASSQALPFGFQGESNVVTSRLPFGIGSFAEGIPFESGSGMILEQDPSIPSTVETPQPKPQEPSVTVSEPAPPSVPSMPDLNVSAPANSTVHDTAPPPAISTPEPLPEPTMTLPVIPQEASPLVQPDQTPLVSPQADNHESLSQPVRLDSARLVTAPDSIETSPDVPDYWKIDAGVPNYDEIYGLDEEIIEVTYDSLDEDVLIYDHESDSPAAVFHSPLEAAPVGTLKPTIDLTLHPIMAMGINIKNHPELGEFLGAGFDGLQQRQWVQAARSFQKIAAKMPSDPYVFNNYGIALLQRALDMKTSDDPHQQSMASAQFDSSILALREAAKNAPTEGEILLNLAHALIESGRSEKALGIMNVHNLRHPESMSGLNTAAVAMFHLGQLSQAMDTFRKASNDPIAKGNLSQFSKAN